MSGIIGTSHSKSKIIGSSLDTAKVWATVDTSGNAINGSFNVSSITDVGTGNHDIAFITPMLNTNYSAHMTFGTLESGENVTVTSGDRSTTQVTIWARYLVWDNSSGNKEGDNVGIAIFGD